MRVRCHAQGKFYTIDCPEGTRLVWGVDRPNDVPFHDHLIVPLNGKEVRIPTDPPELLPLLAESGNFGVSLVGEPEPDESMVGVVCTACGESDVNWLQLRAVLEAVHCDRCGADFDLAASPVVPAPDATKVGRSPGFRAPR